MRKNGLTFIKEYPIVGGYDYSGVVEVVGVEVITVKKGDRIPSFDRREFLGVLPPACLVYGQENVTFEQAAVVPLGLATATTGLWNCNPAMGAHLLNLPAPWEEGGPTAGADNVAFVVGGSSSVGQYGPHPSPEDERLLNHRHNHLPQTRRHPRRAPASSLAFDTIGLPVTQMLAYSALESAGRGGYVTVSITGDPAVAARMRETGHEGIVVSRAAGSSVIPQTAALGAQVLARVGGWLADGTLVPNQVEVLEGGLEGIPDGLARISAGKVRGTKLVVIPSATG
ncbi:GroES-like protein [Epithele typhae]|uniref:GroES-like protein n=1 Tax=Epithele typhae TaxID=378194 RepID=UPI002007D52A|nr:GroES-like protein [Epithele typhae]KAH9921205.1 GroES-like protein [Epithele typhae]